MKKTLLAMALMMPLLAVGQLVEPTGRQTIKKHSGKRYWEYLPRDYATNPTKKYTVVVFLHGKGERGVYPTTNELQEMKKVLLANTPPGQAESYDFPFILISPQLQTGSSWYPGIVNAFVNLARDTTKYRVDLNNIYLVGLSLGGGGVWEQGLTTTNSPRLRGLVPVCGSGNVTANACLAVTNKNRIWAFHGRNDDIVPVTTTERMITAINNCSPDSTTTPIMTIYEDQRHEIWDEAFRLDNELHLPNVYQWIMQTHVGTPHANAGSDKIVTLPTTSIVLNGDGTDVDGTINSYQWKQISGAALTVSGTNTADLQLSNLSLGEYVFRLQVTDNSGWTSIPDDINVTVREIPNVLPVVSLGANKVVKPASSTYTPSLTGTATDSDGTIASYQWTKLSGGDVTLVNANTKTVSLGGITPGLYSFRLTATDNRGGQGVDDIDVRVNAKPIPNAGPDIALNLPQNTVQITGTATDPDGNLTGYLWEQSAGSVATMSGVNTATLTLSNLVVGSYTFKFTAIDNDGSSDRDYVTVVLNANSARVSSADSNDYEEHTYTDFTKDLCEGCEIVVYSLQGKLLYKGKAESEAYHQAVNEARLFHYTLFKHKRKVRSGKVFIKD